MNQLDNYPCICGHPRYMHTDSRKRFMGTCYAKYAENEHGVYYADNCSCYVPDNLLYLERRANELLE